jgi:hypothetical protein|tara:strand:+ start:380 stop:628 length:249 start_codon:yes stop_codon:yes gene_type:complete
MIDVLWVLVGIIIGATGGILAISLISASKFEDGEREIQDLRIQRELLKKEIFRLSKPNRGKPQPRKKRNYKPRNYQPKDKSR